MPRSRWCAAPFAAECVAALGSRRPLQPGHAVQGIPRPAPGRPRHLARSAHPHEGIPTMSLATLPPLTTADRASTTSDRPALRLVPQAAEARGFALYVGVDEEKARAAGVDLATLVEALRPGDAELVPSA